MHKHVGRMYKSVYACNANIRISNFAGLVRHVTFRSRPATSMAKARDQPNLGSHKPQHSTELRELEIAWNRRIKRHSIFIELHQSSKCSKGNNLGILAWLSYILCYVPNIPNAASQTCSEGTHQAQLLLSLGKFQRFWENQQRNEFEKACNNEVAEVADRASFKKGWCLHGRVSSTDLVSCGFCSVHKSWRDTWSTNFLAFVLPNCWNCVLHSTWYHMISHAGSHLSA